MELLMLPSETSDGYYFSSLYFESSDDLFNWNC